MLNPVTDWEPGLQVRYHGTLTELHGVYQAYPCDCLRCDDPNYGAVRYRLVDEQGVTIASCVRAGSITPEPEPDDKDGDCEEDCLGIHRSPDGYRDCDGKPI
ncbi:hypothetical protein ABZ725_14400 [Streptomyces sp. NPDC006872]|uniref:hypothetical protein n=1 Tax=Streptomyces sp. NPDC006872 TaxID=3155720 RepID=UPI0033E49B0B